MPPANRRSVIATTFTAISLHAGPGVALAASPSPGSVAPAIDSATQQAQPLPPRVVATTPELGDDHVDPALTEIIITFSEPIRRGSQSICGGGSSFPVVSGTVRWIDDRTAALSVRLAPGREYALGINCPAANNFRAATGAQVEAFPLRFATRAADAAPRPASPPPTREIQEASFHALRAAVTERYSYRDLRGVDWEAEFAAHRAALVEAPSRAAFAIETARLLRKARDLHISVQLGVARLPTHQPNSRLNCNPDVLKTLVENWTPHGQVVTTGTIPLKLPAPDGTAPAPDPDTKPRPAIGYIAIHTCPQTPEPLQPAIDALARFIDAPGIIIDLRDNGGGSESPVKAFAGCFLDAPAVYSFNDYRDAAAEGGFGKRLSRTVAPAPDSAKLPRYRGRVAVLIGPVVCSSAESFALMLAANPRAVLIGERTLGSSGNPRPCQLPNGIVAILPSWRDFLPDGTLLEGRGIEPGIAVRVTRDELKDSDPVLDAAIAWLRGPTKP